MKAVMNISSQESSTNGALSQPKLNANCLTNNTPSLYDQRNMNSGIYQSGVYMTPNTKKLYAFGESSTFELQ